MNTNDTDDRDYDWQAEVLQPHVDAVLATYLRLGLTRIPVRTVAEQVVKELSANDPKLLIDIIAAKLRDDFTHWAE